MPVTDMRETIAAFLSRHVNRDVPADDDLFAAGEVSSLFALQLVTFLEKTFEIAIEDDDLDVDNFRSIAAIEDFVRRKHAARTVPR